MVFEGEYNEKEQSAKARVEINEGDTKNLLIVGFVGITVVGLYLLGNKNPSNVLKLF